jgi:two-component system, OmpR family, sensor histidine kinase CiaH
LEEACSLLTTRAHTRNISLVRNLREEIGYFGDEAFLRQLFLIFLDNAIKYSPRDTEVRVSLEKQDGAIRARFEDQGIGISSGHLPFIFERFYRAAPSSSGEAQSGGLGLAIAQAIARAQGGSIACESILGIGSTFTIVLPVTPLPEEVPKKISKQKLILN